jgi:hypothetical protein
MCWQVTDTSPKTFTPSTYSKITLPMVLKILDEVVMATHRGIDMIQPQEGSYGFIVKIFGQNGSKFAVKVFKHTIDSELAFLGVDYDTKTFTHVLNIARRNKYQTILYESGFVPTVLRKADNTCPICKCIALQNTHRCADKGSIHHRANVWLNRKIHYHVYMPLMDGNLHDLLRKKYFSIEQRIQIFLSVASVIEKLSHYDIINPDLKAPNILYRKGKSDSEYIYAPCDVGGVYIVGQNRVDLVMDDFKRHLVTNIKTNARRLIGKAHEQDTTKYKSPGTDEVSKPIRWTVATYVDIFLKVDGIKSNYDLSDSTHLTNQFTLLSFFMYMVHITPPSHELVTDYEEYKTNQELYPTMKKYLDDNTGRKLRVHDLCPYILEFVENIWSRSSSWELVGTKHTYIQNIMDGVQRLLDLTKHSPPPRKVLRHSVLKKD